MTAKRRLATAVNPVPMTKDMSVRKDGQIEWNKGSRTDENDNVESADDECDDEVADESRHEHRQQADHRKHRSEVEEILVVKLRCAY